ncbi:MAG: hypothetical protein QM642_01090 [Edaphocola sp.]
MNNQVNPGSPSGEMSFKDFLLLVIKWIKYLFSKWMVLLCVAAIGAGMGCLKYMFATPQYKATTTVILQDDGNSGNSGGGLSIFGLGSSEQAADLFHGDNLKWLYTTRKLLKTTLLTTVDLDGKKQLLIESFIKEDEDVRKALKKSPTLQAVKFSESDNNDSLPPDPKKNQVIDLCVNLLRNKVVKVKDVDKTDGVIEVTVLTAKESLSLAIAHVLVNKVNDYYVKTKTEKAQKQVDELEMAAADYNARMNTAMYQTAASVDDVPYPNPNRQINTVPARRKGVDVELNSRLYSQIMANLEVAKSDLKKATPILQVVDAPTSPLPIDMPNWKIWVSLGAFVLLFLTAVFLIIIKAIKETLAS